MELMHVQLELSGSFLLAVVIMAHAWIGRIQARPIVVNTLAWIFVIFATLVLLASVF